MGFLERFNAFECHKNREHVRITKSRGASRSTCESRGTRHIISETRVLSPFLGHMTGANHVSHCTLSYRRLRPNKKEEVLISLAAHLRFYETRIFFHEITTIKRIKMGQITTEGFLRS